MHYHGQLKLNVNSMSEFYLLFEYIEGPTLSDWYPTVHSLSESLAENQIKFLIDEIISLSPASSTTSINKELSIVM